MDDTARTGCEVLYTPESQLRKPREFLRRLTSDVRGSRELAWRLLVRNISAQYRQTMLGYVWAVLPPLATTALWLFLDAQQVVSFESPGVPYPIFLLTGLVLWQTFVDALGAPLRIATEARPMLAKINFPREALLFTAVGEVGFNFVIRLVLLSAAYVWFGVSVPLTAVLAPVGMVALVALGIMFGVLLVPLGLLYKDFGQGIVLFTQFWLYLTPVVYPPPPNWPASLENWLNPVSPLLLTTRDWLLMGQTAHARAFCAVSAAVFLLLVMGLVVYRLSMPILIERLSA
jgi:lipopolysaccharide transport system permease protein